VYRTSAPEFELSNFEIRAQETPRVTDRRGPEIVFCEQGKLELACGAERLSLAQAESLFIAAAEPAYTITGEGRLFRAAVGRD
jgi:mannose-6-phosphate isomerase class I